MYCRWRRALGGHLRFHLGHLRCRAVVTRGRSGGWRLHRAGLLRPGCEAEQSRHEQSCDRREPSQSSRDFLKNTSEHAFLHTNSAPLLRNHPVGSGVAFGAERSGTARTFICSIPLFLPERNPRPHFHVESRCSSQMQASMITFRAGVLDSRDIHSDQP